MYCQKPWTLDAWGLPILLIGGCRDLNQAIKYMEALVKYSTPGNAKLAESRADIVHKSIQAIKARAQLSHSRELAKATRALQGKPDREGGIRPPTLTMPPPPPKQGGSKT